jgi:argininosuccinate lyase
MQEDKEGVFDAFETAQMCLRVFAPMLRTMKVKGDKMLQAAKGGFINATDLADYLTKKGMPFRSAYQITGILVARCISEGTTLDALPLEVYQTYSPLFEADLYDEIALLNCVEKRTSAGGTGLESVKTQIAYLRDFCAKFAE